MEKQVFVKEIQATFNLREPKGKKPTNIYFVIRMDGKQVKFATGVKVYPDHWNKEKQEAYISFRLSELDNRNNEIANKCNHSNGNSTKGCHTSSNNHHAKRMNHN